MLDEAATAHWTQHGWLWLRGFLGPEAARDLVRWTDELAAWPEVPGKWMRYYERRRSDPEAKMLARIENFVPYHEGLARLFASPVNAIARSWNVASTSWCAVWSGPGGRSRNASS